MPIPSIPVNQVPKTAKERVYYQLKEWIIDGTFKPDEKISDQEIARYFSVSRTPIREALQLLGEQKLVCIYPGKESRVAPVDWKNLNQIYRMISELHVLALSFAYPEITADTIAELESINEELDQALKANDQKQLRKLDSQFHDVFFRIADNDFLTSFADILNIHIERAENLYFSDKKGKGIYSVSEHHAIITALKEQNLQAALDGMRRNWDHTIEILMN
ncbi:MAG: GntR family transcriptional regulator [Eubacteriales bacterium]|nr:GntR family transcriptional regulator [Eubacteriales bacterium]